MTILSRRVRHVATAAGIAVALTAAGAIAYAAIPDPSGAIHGCYDTTLGRLRVIDPASTNPLSNRCVPTETAISWNQTGPQGIPGPQGPQGQQGAKGDTGAQGQKGDPGDPAAMPHLYSGVSSTGEQFMSNTPATIMSVTVPTGQYEIQARLSAANGGSASAEGFCGLVINDVNGPSNEFLLAGGTESPVVILAQETVTGPTVLTISCQAVGQEVYAVSGGVLFATPVTY
ncbi:MAG TPA: hypothetical protein VH333_21775 [Pseudonocardiaceae bacterium]|jgi:hypothetical protein|nr:hypothetical protein [Pseudonocardiaceae bacterium]